MARDLLSALTLKSKLFDAVAKAAETNAVVRIGDGDGLMLVVRPNGESSWVLRYSKGGTRTDLTLGRWPVVTLKMAREQSVEVRRKVVSGTDPLAERKAAREKATKSPDTVRKLFDDWQTKHATSAVYQHNILVAFTKDVLPVIGSMAPQDVTRLQVLEILRTIEGRGALVKLRRVRMWLSQMYQFAVDDEKRPDVTADPVPSGVLKSFGRGRSGNFPAVTDADDVAELMEKLRNVDGNFIIRSALLLSAYVWQRPTEIREAVWSEFNLDKGVWVIPAARMKMQTEHWVPLATQVVALLRILQGVVGDEGLLFPGRRYGKPISDGTLTARLNTLGYLHRHSPHGFRAMARTILDEKLKVDPRFMEKNLSHETKDKLKGAYNRAEFWDDRVIMMQTWADWLDVQTSAS